MSAQPSSALFVLPAIEPDLTFGVLRRTFKQQKNDLVAYVHGKLHPIALPAKVGECDWSPTAARHEVLLPRGATDLLADPQVLAETFERHAVPDQRDLAVVLKVTLAATRPLHEGWEAVRAFAGEALVRDHGLAVVIILHAPFLSGTRTPNPPHIHVVAPARKLTLAGFAAFCDIAKDGAHAPLAAKWAKHRPA